ncbi:unnamed protein product [Closterium sp. Naga37s-1]|nr:unnamed protein product [Closterium sp. Naga37s-1]
MYACQFSISLTNHLPALSSSPHPLLARLQAGTRHTWGAAATGKQRRARQQGGSSDGRGSEGEAARGRQRGGGSKGEAARGRQQGGGSEGEAARGRQRGGGSKGEAARGRQRGGGSKGEAARGRQRGGGSDGSGGMAFAAAANEITGPLLLSTAAQRLLPNDCLPTAAAERLRRGGMAPLLPHRRNLAQGKQQGSVCLPALSTPAAARPGGNAVGDTGAQRMGVGRPGAAEEVQRRGGAEERRCRGEEVPESLTGGAPLPFTFTGPTLGLCGYSHTSSTLALGSVLFHASVSRPPDPHSVLTPPPSIPFSTWGEEGEGAARRGSKRTSLLNPRLPFLQGFTWGEEGDGAARAHQVASLWLTPPFHSLQYGGQRGDDTAGGTDGGEVLLHRCSGIYSWDEEGDGAARAHQEASLWLTPPFHSLQHGGQRGDDVAGGTDGGEVLLHRCSGVYSWGEEGDGAARAHQEASLWLTPPFHSLQHGGQRGDDTAGGTGGGSKTEDRLRLRHRCCAAGVADGVGTDASRA